MQVVILYFAKPEFECYFIKYSPRNTAVPCNERFTVVLGLHSPSPHTIDLRVQPHSSFYHLLSLQALLLPSHDERAKHTAMETNAHEKDNSLCPH